MVDTTVKLTVNGDTMTGGEWVAMTDENGSSRFAVSFRFERAP